MKSHVLILILTTIALSGCSSVPVSSVNSTVESPAGTKKTCKRVPRHKTHIKLCRPETKLN